MPRKLGFIYQKHAFECSLHKVDRSKLYGARRVETLDMDENPCTLATLLDDGKTLVPRGGTASGYINPDGEWVSRKMITPVDRDGKPLETVPSSFETGLALKDTVAASEFLDHSIRLCYALLGDDLPRRWTRRWPGAIFSKPCSAIAAASTRIPPLSCGALTTPTGC